MFNIPPEVRDTFKKKFSGENIDKVLEDYFQWRFEYSGFKGLTITNSLVDSKLDNELLFGTICQQFADNIKAKYEYFPFNIDIRQTSYSDYYGMSITYFDCTIKVDPCTVERKFSTINLGIMYSWLEPRKGKDSIDNYSHSQYWVNLADPGAIESTNKLLLFLCESALTQRPPRTASP